jgi:hypothetical protein
MTDAPAYAATMATPTLVRPDSSIPTAPGDTRPKGGC